MVTVSNSGFGRQEVESRVNVSKEHAHHHTLECVATAHGEQAYTLFAMGGEITHSHSHKHALALYLCWAGVGADGMGLLVAECAGWN